MTSIQDGCCAIKANDRAAMERHGASLESVVTAVTMESIQEKKFADGEDEQAVQRLTRWINACDNWQAK